jgi:hypothetical protein
MSTYNRFKVALEAQDAVNLRALAREFVTIVDKAMEETGSTTETWADPAVRLMVNKFEALCRTDENYGEAYYACQERAKEG